MAQNFDQAYLETLREKRNIIEEKQRLRKENKNKNNQLFEKYLFQEIEMLQKNQVIFDKRNELFLNNYDDLKKKYNKKLIDYKTSDFHLKEMKLNFHNFLIENYPNLAKDIKHAMFNEKLDLDKRLKLVLQNTEAIKKEQLEIEKMKQEIELKKKEIKNETRNINPNADILRKISNNDNNSENMFSSKNKNQYAANYNDHDSSIRSLNENQSLKENYNNLLTFEGKRGKEDPIFIKSIDPKSKFEVNNKQIYNEYDKKANDSYEENKAQNSYRESSFDNINNNKINKSNDNNINENEENLSNKNYYGQNFDYNESNKNENNSFRNKEELSEDKNYNIDYENEYPNNFENDGDDNRKKNILGLISGSSEYISERDGKGFKKNNNLGFHNSNLTNLNQFIYKPKKKESNYDKKESFNMLEAHDDEFDDNS